MIDDIVVVVLASIGFACLMILCALWLTWQEDNDAS